MKVGDLLMLSRKDKYKLAREQGFTSKEAGKLRSYSDKHFNNELAKKRRRDNYKYARDRGLTAKEASSVRNAKNQETLERNIETIILNKSQLYLVVVYKDITENTDAGYINRYKGMLKGKVNRNTLVVNTLDSLLNPESIGELGNYEMSVFDKEEVNSYIQLKHMELYRPIYKGQGKNLKNLESLCAMMMALLYENWRKFAFIMDLVKNLRMLDNKKARQNARIIEKEYLEFIENQKKRR